MQMDNIVKKWVERAEYDLKTARAMLSARRYLYVAFMCQQSLEKILKAIIVYKGGEIKPIHNLVRLAELAGIYQFQDDGNRDFLADLTPFAIEARYGDYRDKLSEIIDGKTAGIYFKKTRKLFECLLNKIKK